MPPMFFRLWGYQKPKLNLGTFLAQKTTLKVIFNIIRSLSLVAKWQQSSVNIIVEKFKVLSFMGIVHLK